MFGFHSIPLVTYLIFNIQKNNNSSSVVEKVLFLSSLNDKFRKKLNCKIFNLNKIETCLILLETVEGLLITFTVQKNLIIEKHILFFSLEY